MGKVKCNKGGIASFIAYVEQLKSTVDSFFAGSVTGVEAENNTALANLQSREISQTIVDSNGNSVSNPAYEANQAKIQIAEANSGKISAALGKQAEIDAVLDKVLSGLNKINDAVNQFESTSGEVEFTVDASVRTVTNGATGIEVNQLVFEVTDPDGTTREFTISELLNAFYTSQGMEMNSVYQAALLRQELGLDPLTDEDILHVLQTSKSIMNFVFDIGMYGISSEEDLKNYKKNLKEAGFDVSEDVSTLIKSVDFGDEETRKKALKYLLSATNGAVFAGAVSAGVAGLYGLYNNDSVVELADDKNKNGTNNNDYSGNTGGVGGYYGGGVAGSATTPATEENPKEKEEKEKDKDTPTDPEESPTEPEEKETITDTEPDTEKIPGVITPLEESKEPLETPEDVSELPTEELPTIPEGIEKDYDDLARRQFEAQGEEKISEHRADIIERANRLFESEDKSELRALLKKYGYSDSDIETIIQDRDLTINAMVSGDQREQLAKIANELAKKDGVEEFDTTYDDEQKVSSLTDGTTTKLLSILNSDEDVKKAYEELATMENTYTEANTAVTTAMANVEAAKAKIEEITNSIGEKIKTEPSQWDENTLKLYNDEVTKLYEDTIEKNGEKSEWTDDQMKEYEGKVEELKEKYAEKALVDKDNATWSKEQIEEYNKAVKEYNEAVKEAKESMTKLTEAKESYETAKTSLDTAKENFYKKVVDEQKVINDNNRQVEMNAPIDTQENSGTPEIGGIVVTEQGATIGVENVATSNEQIVNDDDINITMPDQATPTTVTTDKPQEVIVNDDEQPIDYGIPIVDISSNNSGTITNDSIKL